MWKKVCGSLACLHRRETSLSLFGDVKETAAASELQRERKENVFSSVRASSALVSPSVRVRPIIIVILVADWRGLGGSLARRVVTNVFTSMTSLVYLFKGGESEMTHSMALHKVLDT